MSSKIVGADSNFFGRLVVDALQAVKTTNDQVGVRVCKGLTGCVGGLTGCVGGLIGCDGLWDVPCWAPSLASRRAWGVCGMLVQSVSSPPPPPPPALQCPHTEHHHCFPVPSYHPPTLTPLLCPSLCFPLPTPSPPAPTPTHALSPPPGQGALPGEGHQRAQGTRQEQRGELPGARVRPQPGARSTGHAHTVRRLRVDRRGGGAR